MDHNQLNVIDAPDHIKKVGNNTYEEKLRAIIVNDRGLDEASFDKYRLEYSNSLDAEKVLDKNLPDFPTTVSVELVNKCNYKCTMCFTVNHEGPMISLNLEDVCRLIDECAENGLMTLFLGSGSEATIYPQLLQVVEHACARIPDVALFTNGSRLNPELSRQLIDKGVSRVNISLDAATQATYSKIRGKDNLSSIESNIDALISLKNHYQRPLVRVSFCKQPLNSHEEMEFIAKWSNRVDSVEIQSLHTFDNMSSLSKCTASNFDDVNLTDNDTYCYSPFSYLAVWSSGDISPCCTFHGQKLVLGNIHNSTLSQAWSSSMMNSIRKQFSMKALNSICSDCMSATKSI
jgi:radical SAM protein with 4Fe4S-binding SPASM domain